MPAMVTVATLTVQIFVEFDVKLTASPESEVAPIVNGATPKLTLLRVPNVMV